MILVCTESLEFCNNNLLEIKVAIIGLLNSPYLDLSNVIIEMDSHLIEDMINGTSNPSWRFQHLIEVIRH